MAWTARLRDKRLVNGKWDVAIIYTDGVQTVVRGYQFDSINELAIRAQVRAEVARMNAAQAEVPTLADGAVIDLTEPAAPLPTAAELARAAWFVDYGKLLKLRRLVDAGLLPANDARITNLQTSLKAGWVNSYLDGI